MEVVLTLIVIGWGFAFGAKVQQAVDPGQKQGTVFYGEKYNEKPSWFSGRE